jgi:hypothetical protein
MPESSTENLAKLIRQKRQLLEQLLAVGRKQGELIYQGDIQSLLKLLASKQQLIAAMHSIENALRPFQAENPDTRVWRSAELRSVCASDAEACSQLLTEVMAIEKAHEEQMIHRRDAVSQQLRQAQSAHNAAAAYQPHIRNQPQPPLPAINQPIEADPASSSIPQSASLDLTSGQ